jgi:hypothetical protein
MLRNIITSSALALALLSLPAFGSFEPDESSNSQQTSAQASNDQTDLLRQINSLNEPVKPKVLAQKEEYLGLAKQLNQALAEIDGTVEEVTLPDFDESKMQQYRQDAECAVPKTYPESEFSKQQREKILAKVIEKQRECDFYKKEEYRKHMYAWHKTNICDICYIYHEYDTRHDRCGY